MSIQNFWIGQYQYIQRKEITLKPVEQKLVKVRAPFIDEILGLTIIKIIDGSTNNMLAFVSYWSLLEGHLV